MSDTVIGILTGLVLAVFILFVGAASGAGLTRNETLQECLAHQEWCVEHYQLEEGK